MFLTILFIIFALGLLYCLVVFRFGYVESDNYVCLVGKTAIVTGGSSGIGYHTVLSLASRGCKVIIADKIVNEEIKNHIIEETENPNIILEYVDFTSFKSIRNFAKKITTYVDKVDILMNNVGIGKAPETPSEDGLNQTMQINHYGPFLLTHLLIDLLKKSGSARIVFTTSTASFFSELSLEDVTKDGIKDARRRYLDYANAKLLNIVASDIFAEKLKQYNITSNCFHPGVVRSDFFKNTREHLNVFDYTDVLAYASIVMLRFFGGVEPKNACQAGVNLAISKKFKNTTGTFFGKYCPNLKPKLARDKILCSKLWTASEKMVKLKPEEILN